MEEIYTSKLAYGITNETQEQEPLSLEEAQINALATLADTAGALSRAVSKIAAYVPTQWVDNSEPSITAARLMHIENGIRDATNAVNNAIDSITELNGRIKYITKGSFTIEISNVHETRITVPGDFNNLDNYFVIIFPGGSEILDKTWSYYIRESNKSSFVAGFSISSPGSYLFKYIVIA